MWGRTIVRELTERKLPLVSLSTSLFSASSSFSSSSFWAGIPLIFQFCESKFFSSTVVEYIRDVIFVKVNSWKWKKKAERTLWTAEGANGVTKSQWTYCTFTEWAMWQNTCCQYISPRGPPTYECLKGLFHWVTLISVPALLPIFNNHLFCVILTKLRWVDLGPKLGLVLELCKLFLDSTVLL